MDRSGGSIAIRRLALDSDDRGWRLGLPDEALAFLGRVAELHWVSIEPGAVRGNHAHHRRREAVLVRYDGPWTLAWRLPDGTRGRETFGGVGAVCAWFAPGVAHALRNEGRGALLVVAFSDRRAEPGDTVRVALL